MNIRPIKMLVLSVIVISLLVVPVVLAAHATGGVDVEVINDNNNVDGGTPNPGFDAQNRQSNETSIAISPANPNIVAAGANDYRMAPVFGDSWLGFYVSTDGGANWFNTMVPGFPSDTSAAGLASPLLNLDGSGDPVVRFDAAGNLYAAGIAFNRNFDQPDRPVDNVVYVAKYNYTPGSSGGRARRTRLPTRLTSRMPERRSLTGARSASPCRISRLPSLENSSTRNGWRSTRTRPAPARATSM